MVDAFASFVSSSLTVLLILLMDFNSVASEVLDATTMFFSMSVFNDSMLSLVCDFVFVKWYACDISISCLMASKSSIEVVASRVR